MVFGIKGTNKQSSQRSYGGKGSYKRGTYSKRGGGYETKGPAYHSDEDGYYGDAHYGDEYPDGYYDDGSEMDVRDEGRERERELVTRDQVLGELRAQAAADALGQSLEQMGYNLDNCDSFYSLSDNEKRENRYIIQQKDSDLENGTKRKTDAKRRAGKNRKKKGKGRPSRYTVTSDDDEYTEDFTKRRDYDTLADSSIDSDEDSYYLEDGTYVTGQDSRLTDPSKRTGKKPRSAKRAGKREIPPKTAKSKPRRMHDNDSYYYSRGTEWTTGGDSSYYRTIGNNSTLSSGSSFEEDASDMEDSVYTEVTNDDIEIRPRHKHRRHGKKIKKRREMEAIREKDSNSEDDEDDADEVLERQPKDHKRRSKKKAKAKRSGSSRFSGNSFIGAMRSVSFSKEDEDMGELEQRSRQTEKKGLTKEKNKDRKKEEETIHSLSSSKDSHGKEKLASRQRIKKNAASEFDYDDAGFSSDDPDTFDEKEKKDHDGKRHAGKYVDSEPEAESKKYKKKRSKDKKSRQLTISDVAESAGQSELKSRRSKEPISHAKGNLPVETLNDDISELSEPEIESKAAVSKKSKMSKKSNQKYAAGKDGSEKTKEAEEEHAKSDRFYDTKDVVSDSDGHFSREKGQKKEAINKQKSSKDKTKSKDKANSKDTNGQTDNNKATAARKAMSKPNEKPEESLASKKKSATVGNVEEDDEKSTKTSGTKITKVSRALTAASKKFWPRQFLPRRGKEEDESQEKDSTAFEEKGERSMSQAGGDNVRKSDRGPKMTKEEELKAHQNEPPKEEDFDANKKLEETRDDINDLSRDRSCSSGRSRGRSMSANNNRKSRSRTSYSGRSRSPSHRSQANSKGAESARSRRSSKRGTAGINEDALFSAKEDQGAMNGETSDKTNVGNSSLGICEVAAMAALIPLAPLAAIYSCYTADATQTLMGNATNACAQSCDVSPCDGTIEMQKQISKTTQSRRGKDIGPGQLDAYNMKKCGRSVGPNKPDSDRSFNLNQDELNALSKIPTLQKTFLTLGNTDGTVHSPSKPSRLLSPLSPRSPQSKPSQILPPTTIQEAEEGFESFLPGLVGNGSNIRNDDAMAASSQAQSLLSSQQGNSKNLWIKDSTIQRVQAEVSSAPPKSRLWTQMKDHKLQQETAEKSKKGGKRWLPRLGKLLLGTKQGQQEHRRTVSVSELPKSSKTQQLKHWSGLNSPLDTPNQVIERTDNLKGQSLLPDRLPFEKASKKKENSVMTDAESVQAIKSYLGDTPVAHRARRMLEKDHYDSREGNFVEPFSPIGGLGPFTCSKSNTCGNDEFDNSVISYKTDDVRTSSYPTKSRSRNSKGSKSKRDEALQGININDLNVPQEDVLKYYDLDQTLSDVIDARHTLGNAYGALSGGGSFDHTIDEQLVELLAHMAEMNHSDAVEIEAAIKKLKRHARKLGISERDLLFSVKSAEESALSMTGDEEFTTRDRSLEMPSTFGDKMLDAFEGYFSGK